MNLETLALVALCLISLASLGVSFVLLRRGRQPALDLTGIEARLLALDRAQERAERAMRDETARVRTEAAAASRELRAEVMTAVTSLTKSLVSSVDALAAAQRTQIERLTAEMSALVKSTRDESHALRDGLTRGLADGAEATTRRLSEMAQQQLTQLEQFRQQIAALTDGVQRQLDQVRETVAAQLGQLQADNAARLDQMRQVVDEKLQGTLDQRLSESFRQVSERLEQVHRGLGEMHTLAAGVGDLKKVLANVKSRGTWGEVQLHALLEQVLAPDQYAANVATRPGSPERVEFAIRLPGPEGREGDTVWLPIDAKFPLEDYQRLVDATERGDADGVQQAGKDLETRIRACARAIAERYLEVPYTTDFGILFLPTEGLYAEVLRRAGLVDQIQRQCRVLVAGPTTLWAILGSLRMGFRTLAIQRRSSEVWAVLGTVKTEFGRFGQTLDAVYKKLREASNKIEEAQRGSRRIERKLQDVQELPAASGPARTLAERSLFPAEDEEVEAPATEP